MKSQAESNLKWSLGGIAVKLMMSNATFSFFLSPIKMAMELMTFSFIHTYKQTATIYDLTIHISGNCIPSKKTQTKVSLLRHSTYDTKDFIQKSGIIDPLDLEFHDPFFVPD